MSDFEKKLEDEAKDAFDKYFTYDIQEKKHHQSKDYTKEQMKDIVLKEIDDSEKKLKEAYSLKEKLEKSIDQQAESSLKKYFKE